MEAVITLDTLYLHIKYPYRDVFDIWYVYAKHCDPRILKEGYVAEDFVIRNGASGYKVSIWKHDARIYLTDQVDEICGDGQGMGVWIQLGPKFLIANLGNLNQAVKEFVESVGITLELPISITRLDIAVDMLGVSMADQDLNHWSENWVGRSKLSAMFRNSRTGVLETMYIGSRKSPVFIRVYDKVSQAFSEGDLVYWMDIWGNFQGPVTRIEWEVKPKDGNFTVDLKDLSLFNGFSIRELMNYLIDWGRLCDPNPNDSNRRRWNDSQFWADLRTSIKQWSDDVDWPTSRYGKEFHGVSDPYIKFLTGVLSGGMARLCENDPTMIGLAQGLLNHGEDLKSISNKARMKAARIKRL